MAPRTPGYSGKPLVQKLGLRSDHVVCVLGVGPAYETLVSPWPDGARRVQRLTAKTNFVHVFENDATRLGSILRSVRSRMPNDGIVWVSWPKKASKVPTNVTEDTIRSLAWAWWT